MVEELRGDLRDLVPNVDDLYPCPDAIELHFLG